MVVVVIGRCVAVDDPMVVVGTAVVVAVVCVSVAEAAVVSVMTASVVAAEADVAVVVGVSSGTVLLQAQSKSAITNTHTNHPYRFKLITSYSNNSSSSSAVRSVREGVTPSTTD